MTVTLFPTWNRFVWPLSATVFFPPSPSFLSPQAWLPLSPRITRELGESYELEKSATVKQTQGRLWFPSSCSSWIISAVVLNGWMYSTACVWNEVSWSQCSTLLGRRFCDDSGAKTHLQDRCWHMLHICVCRNTHTNTPYLFHDVSWTSLGSWMTSLLR